MPRILDRVLFGRIQASFGVVVWVVTILGCMSINLGGGESKPSDPSGVLVQEGKIPIRPGSEQIIHYPKAYLTPPNLELDDSFGVCDIVEQKENYFRVKFRPSMAIGSQTIAWKTRGVDPTQSASSPVGSTLPPTITPVSTSNQ